MIKKIVLCADDYGQSFSISQAILNLVHAQRLAAVSCLINLPQIENYVRQLLAYQSQIDIGLHFNLSLGEALSPQYKQYYGQHFFSLPQLLFRTSARCLKKEPIAAEFHAQIDQFQGTYGFLPQFVDGHQHIHQLPIIRNVVAEVFKQRLSHGSYLRWVNPGTYFCSLPLLLKQMVLKSVGHPQAVRKKLQQASIAHNASFSGLYPFKGNYQLWFKWFLQRIEDKGLIMCHPGLGGEEALDKLSAIRYQEYCYLLSDAFLKDCWQQHIQIKRFTIDK